MRWLVELLMRNWPFNQMMIAFWRYLPFPRGMRSSIMRTANDKFLVGVVALICDDEGRVLLVRNTYDPRFFWTLPGGWMGRHEQPEECIRRELREETGYEIELDELVAARSNARLPSLDMVFRGRLASGAFRPSAEVVDARFFGVDQFPDGLTPRHQRLLDTIPIHKRV